MGFGLRHCESRRGLRARGGGTRKRNNAAFASHVLRSDDVSGSKCSDPMIPLPSDLGPSLDTLEFYLHQTICVEVKFKLIYTLVHLNACGLR